MDDPILANAAGDRSTTKPRRYRFLFWTLTALLWLGVLAIAGELFARRLTSSMVEQGTLLQQARAQHNDTALREALPAAILTLVDFDEHVRQFLEADEAQRRAWVNERMEGVIVSDEDGLVIKKYTPETDESVRGILNCLSPQKPLGQQLRILYESPELASPIDALERSLRDESPLNILWPQPLACPNGEGNLYQIRLRSVDAITSGERLIFLRRSIWETWGRTYRPDVELTDGFEWSADELPTISFSTNSHGFRGSEVAVPKPDGVYRIVCLGGSTTVEGPTDELTYPAILQQKLRARFNTEKIEVINAGRHGSSVTHEANSVPALLALEPDLVLHYNFVNDYRSMACSVWYRPEETSRMSTWSRTYVLRSHLLFHTLPSVLMPMWAEVEKDYENFLYQPLRRMTSELRANGVAVGLMSFACPVPAESEQTFFEFRHYRWLFNRNFNGFNGYAKYVEHYNIGLKRLAAESGVAYIPLAEQLETYPENFTDICHLNLAGIEQKAHIVAELLQEIVTANLPSKASLTLP